MTLGKYYEIEGDTISAYSCYNRALSDIDKDLSSSKPGDNKYELDLMEKGQVLILLNKPDIAHRVLKEALGKESIEVVKRYLNRLMNMSRHELLYEKAVPEFI